MLNEINVKEVLFSIDNDLQLLVDNTLCSGRVPFIMSATVHNRGRQKADLDQWVDFGIVTSHKGNSIVLCP